MRSCLDGTSKGDAITFWGGANYLSDRWQIIAKSHLLGCQITLFGKVHTMELEDPSTEHDGVSTFGNCYEEFALS